MPWHAVPCCGCPAPTSHLLQLLVQLSNLLLRISLLLQVMCVDSAAVLRAPVVALAVQGGWIHTVKKHVQQLAE
jgi:hypothetical protein